MTKSTPIAIAFLFLFLIAGFPFAGTADAADPVYSLDIMRDHPYRFMPAYGHASQSPGSPKWFRPGYGYQIPGFGFSASPLRSTTDRFYQSTLPFTRSGSQSSYWQNGRTPWLLPGSPPSPAFPIRSMGW